MCNRFRQALLSAGFLATSFGFATAQPAITLPSTSAAEAAARSGPSVPDQEVTAVTGPLRLDPYYEPKGIPLGGPFRLFTALSLDGSYDDNVYRTATAKAPDWFFTIAPAMVLDYQTSAARVDLYGQADIYQYAKLTAVNTTNYEVGLQGQYEASRAIQLSGAASYKELSEPLSSPNVVGFQASPTQYTDTSVNGAVSYKPNRFSFVLGFGYDNYDFLNAPLIGGGFFGNADRNNELLRGIVEAGYDFSPGYTTFLRFTYNDNPYERALDRSGIHRSSHGYQADAGLRLLLGDLIQGEVYTGYVTQDYDQTQATPLHDVSGLDFGAKLTWYPTNLMTVTLGASRNIQNTTLAGASAGDDKNVSLSASYSVTRQFTLQATSAYDDVSYKGTSPLREDQTYLLGFGGRYLVSHYVSLDLDYRYTNRTSSVPSVAFNDDLVMLGLNLQI